jgi:hypothetical protein
MSADNDPVEPWNIYEIESVTRASATGDTRAFERVLYKGPLVNARLILPVKIHRSLTESHQTLWFGTNLPDPDSNIGHWRHPLPKIEFVTVRDDWLSFSETKLPFFAVDVWHQIPQWSNAN